MIDVFDLLDLYQVNPLTLSNVFQKVIKTLLSFAQGAVKRKN